MPAASSATATTTVTTNGRSSRSGSSKKMVVLKLSPDLLSQFATPLPEIKETKKRNSDTPAQSPVKIKEPSSPASSSAELPPPPSSVDNASDAASTPAAGTSAADTPRRKGVPGPKPGSKRGLGQTGETYPRPRGKPGPKKKPRLDDGTVDHVKLSANHKLGPKANLGAINAGLRALDRTGAPCRKWERKPLQLKSFTGIQWALPTWRAPRPQKPEENGEAKEMALETGDSDSKANQSASGVPSEKSNGGDGDLTPLPSNIHDASSPAPAIAMTA
ncbi:uncharacterized protein BO97DRAFT_196461 [Aspergillus homomorphus CBS 101889]|uniref:DUF1711-domain-containing protein n=1 Tax=Aspergillus homomorphus (strain CBS 101889) TaxID=1450537 RepID=A0A395HM05_ASPHC|nr:DUF1711-domain-containing protein [Aspergillus homomorphus CBS 101889]RAL08646.1 DUF1711-domain-containing protein [Aspergillus homomorphus CBS 101889]